MQTQSNRRNVICFLFLLTLLANSNLLAQDSYLTLNGGITKAVGSGSEIMNFGFNGCANFLISATPNSYVGAKLAYNHLGYKKSFIRDLTGSNNVSMSISILEILGIVRFTNRDPVEHSQRFFGQLGFGLYNMEAKASVNNSSISSSESINKPGFNLGFGFFIKNGDKNEIELSPQLNLVLTEDETTKYFTINVGIVFD